MNWDADRRPAAVQAGRTGTLQALGDCAAYILDLPKRQQDNPQPQWHMVTAELQKTAEQGSIFRFIAQMAFGRALRRRRRWSNPGAARRGGRPRRRNERR